MTVIPTNKTSRWAKKETNNKWRRTSELELVLLVVGLPENILFGQPMLLYATENLREMDTYT